MPNQETSVDQYRNSATTTSHRKASFIENLTPNSHSSQSRKNSHGSAPPKPVKEEVLYRSKSIQLSEYTFSDSQGNQKSTEVIHKRFINDEPVTVCELPTIQTELAENDSQTTVNCCHAQSVENPEGILSIAILKRHILCDCLILVKKYRPSLKSFVLEFPAKMVEHNRCAAESSDGNESDSSIGDAAVKDVEDNTGYRSTKVNWVSPETAMDPELCDNKLKIVSLVIDGDDPIKNNFVNNCSSSDEEGSHQCTTDCMDDIEVIPVPINGLLDRLNEYSRRNVVIDSRVYAFAIGLKKGERLAQNAIKPEKIEMPI